MIANYMFFDIDLPCFSRKLIRVNNPRVAYVTTGTGNKIKNFGTHIHTGLRSGRRGKERGSNPSRPSVGSIDLERRRNVVNRKTVRDGGLR